MKRSGWLVIMVILAKVAPADEDTLSGRRHSGKWLRKSAETSKAYRVELISGDEQIRAIYSVPNRNSTLLLKRNRQYALKVIANGNEREQMFNNTKMVSENK